MGSLLCKIWGKESGRFNILLILLACIFSIILATIFIGNALSKTNGEIILPLDDPYIFFVYARNAAQGHLFHYNVEDPPSLGLTSLSYYFLCTIGYIAGFQGKNIVWFSHIIALAAFAGSLIIAATFYKRRSISMPFLAAVLTFSMGKILWGFYCGMEVPILSFLLFAACCAFVDGRTRLFFILLTLASLTRPEICLLLFGASLIYGLTALKSKKYIHAFYFLIPLVICFLIYGSVFLITGSFFNTAQKSLFFTGDFSLGRLVIRMNENYSTLLTYIWGYGTGFLVLTTLLILGLLRLKDREWIFPAVFFFGFFVEGILAFGMWHHQRYFISYLPEGMVMLIIGWERLLKETPKILQLARICILLLFGWNILYWADLYGDNCRDLKWLNGKSLQFINNYIDDSAILLVSDAGLIKYYSDRYVIDFIGLGARRLTASNTRGGSGCVFEEMRRILPEKAGKNKKARQVYGFAFWQFGADALEKMAYWKPADFLKSASKGDMVLMALHDNGLGPLDEEMIRCLKNLKLDWREMVDVPRPDTSVAGYALVGDYNITALRRQSYVASAPEAAAKAGYAHTHYEP
jgi:hypothetical protein